MPTAPMSLMTAASLWANATTEPARRRYARAVMEAAGRAGQAAPVYPASSPLRPDASGAAEEIRRGADLGWPNGSRGATVAQLDALDCLCGLACAVYQRAVRREG